MRTTNFLSENKKFKEIISYIKEHLQNAEFTLHALEHTNKLMPKSGPMYTFGELTGKTFEVEIKNALEYSSYQEALRNNRKYFFVVKSEPLGANEFPDFLLGVAEVKKKGKDIFWIYLENKTYSKNYSFGTSSLDALLDNILTKIGEPTRLGNKIKRVDKLTTPILIEKFGEEIISPKSKKYYIEDIQIFQMYEVLGFNASGGFTTKNSLKNTMVAPISSANATICGSIDDWLREFKYNLLEKKESQLIKTLASLNLSVEDTIKIIENRLINPILYQDMRNVNYDFGKTPIKLF